MARKRNSPPPGDEAWKQSPFYKELLKRSAKGDAGARSLLGKVEHVAGKAADISRYVVTFLPQYTDHGERHLTNVLQFMAELAGTENIQKLSSLECALAIMAAMTHDLGMVLDEKEAQAVTDSTEEPTTPEGKAWQTYRDGHSLWHAYRRLSSDERNTPRAGRMLGQVKADYIRESHARELGQAGYHRVLRWLDKLARDQGQGFYIHKQFSFREGLAHLALSHGQDIGWLPERLAAEDSPYAEVKEDRSRVFACGSDEVNWPWLSWLLRLADVMDCDASRTPAVLFENIGITDPVSQTEWKKHLSIPERPKFHVGEDGETLLYQCPCCPDPFTEKAIRDILGWINDEITHVRRELDLGRRHFPRSKRLGLDLPSKADVRITERANNYDYLDLHFRLDRTAVMELLMGEALYGEPDLALRELVQNSLDALHLRDLRLKLLGKLQAEGGGEQLPVPVAALNADVEPLEVQVSWDTPTDKTQRPWIQVADNGVGMSREVIRRFLTEIGKSYYKSPDFLRERELMKRHGLLCTTISQFGIGFLSAFMLAEDVELETRAAGLDGALETGWRVRIHGAHGLIALYPLAKGGFKTTGTRVKLTLKPGLSLEDFALPKLRKRLRKSFYDRGDFTDGDWKPPENDFVEPAWSVARCIVWPLFPVRLQPPREKPVVLDESFHRQELLPLDIGAIRAKAEEWTYPGAGLDDSRWETLEWADVGSGGTGSRLRLTLPWHTTEPVSQRLPNDVPGKVRRSELFSLTEPQLPSVGRTLVLVNGVRVPEWKVPLAAWLKQSAGVGALLWLDLRGAATPRLRADRQAPTTRQEVEGLVGELQERFHTHCARRDAGADGWLRLAITGLPPLETMSAHQAWSLGARLPQLQEVALRGEGGTKAFHQEIEVTAYVVRDLDLASDFDLARDHYLNKYFRRGFVPALAGARNIDRDIARDIARDIDRACQLSRVSVRDIDRDFDRDFASERARARVLAGAFAFRGGVFSHWHQWLQCQMLPEGFQPSLEQAFPPWGMTGLRGSVGQLVLAAR